MNQYFLKPNGPFGGDINVNADLSNYATKADIKIISHIDTSSSALKSNLASLKTEVDKLNIYKLVPVPVDLSKLSDVVKNDVVKKSVYDKLIAKKNCINTSGFVLKIKYDAGKSETENKFSDTIGLLNKTDYNAKVIAIEGKIPIISGLATDAALSPVENNIPNVSNVVKKTDYGTKITEIEHDHDKYVTTLEFNKLSSKVFDARLSSSYFDDKRKSEKQKNSSNKIKNLLNENEFKMLKTFDFSYFKGKRHFEEDDTQ